MEVGDRESDVPRDCSILPAPGPPFLDAGEARDLPRLERVLAEHDREGQLADLIDRCGETDAGAWPVGVDLGHHGGIGVHDPFDLGVTADADEETGAEDLRRSPEWPLMDVDTFPCIFQIEAAQIIQCP